MLNEDLELKATLKEAELASCSVELLLPLFKNTVEDISLENVNLSESNLKKISEQKEILTRELDTFNRVKVALEHLLRETDYKQAGDNLPSMLLKNLADNESENINLKKKVLEKETYIQELSSLFQNEKENALKANRFSQSVKMVHDRLQLQIQKREAENSRLKEYIKSLEIKIAKWNLQLKANKQEAGTMKEVSQQKAAALKKASRIYKQRLRHFTGDIEHLTAQIRHQNTLDALTDEVVCIENELLELQEVEKRQKSLIEVYKTQVQKLQEAAKTVKSRCEDLLHENNLIKNKNKKAEKMRGQVESQLKEAEEVHHSSMSAGQRPRECQEIEEVFPSSTSTGQRPRECQEIEEVCHSLMSAGWRPSECQKVEGNHMLLTKLSLEEENYLIQLKCENLKQKLDQMDAENKELERKLAEQEECLRQNNLKLKEKSSEYTALARQLETALEEGRHKVSEEIEKISSRERAFQIKILDLETELRKKNEEQNQLVCKMNSKAQHQEMCLKEIQHNLEKSENQNESIKNYLQFLQTSYVTMFG